ncbi:DUF2894 domain-containing protein [Aquabacterium sp.]|uniref:DUF2894 domain-containing protein n=1 Tax=Aquabacterium TaxID=92793 RepID=UPI001DA9C49C|nr:DUF2894 domain-containing protein [Aquabacterium sp.]MBT9610456.1 DUF2894 domain-containing protein [Aquabacterium sp.]|tara:strand:+ start:91 stop:669 length:579 start_codon:yes stop_codon:yes gene_type:complete
MNDSDFSAALAALQQAGAAQRDPIGFQHMVLMAQRLQTQPGAVQRLLAGRLREALARAEALAETRATEAAPASSPSPVKPGPLAQLHRHLQAISQPAQAKAPRPELKSLDRFRGTWAKVAADAQVDKALARAPENAGPLNSHLLVLRSLAALRELSPEHLHGVLAQLDALLWLEQATQKPTATPGRRTGTKK